MSCYDEAFLRGLDAAQLDTVLGPYKSLRVGLRNGIVSSPNLDPAMHDSLGFFEDALSEDLRRLCSEDEVLSALQEPFRDTSAVLREWPRLKIHLKDLEEVVIANLEHHGFGTVIGNHIELQGAPSVPLAAFATRHGQLPLSPSSSSCVKRLRFDVEVLSNGLQVLEASKQSFLLSTNADVHVFAARPFIFLPEAFMADQATFEQEFGGKSSFFTESPITMEFAKTFIKEMLEAASWHRITYSWNQTFAARRLRLGYRAVAPGQRSSYLDFAATHLAEAIGHDTLGLGCYRPIEPLVQSLRADWKDWISLIDAERVVFSIRHPKTFSILNGFSLKPRFLQPILQNLSKLDFKRSWLGEQLLEGVNWGDTPNFLSSFAAHLRSNIEPIKHSQQPLNSAWWFVAQSLVESENEPVLPGAETAVPSIAKHSRSNLSLSRKLNSMHSASDIKRMESRLDSIIYPGTLDQKLHDVGNLFVFYHTLTEFERRLTQQELGRVTRLLSYLLAEERDPQSLAYRTVGNGMQTIRAHFARTFGLDHDASYESVCDYALEKGIFSKEPRDDVELEAFAKYSSYELFGRGREPLDLDFSRLVDRDWSPSL